MSQIRAILFDKDGTLLDFNRTWLPAYRAAAKILAAESHGKLSVEQVLVDGGFIPEEENWQPESVLAAGSNREILASWNKLLGRSLGIGTIGRIEQEFLAASKRLAPAVEQIDQCLNALREAGFILGIATMDSEAGAQAMVKTLALESQFSFVCGADSGFGEKPDPGMVHAFADSTGIEAQQIVMVGDSPRDIEMGMNAGAGLSVGVTSGAHSREELLRYSPHVLAHIGELNDYLQQAAIN